MRKFIEPMLSALELRPVLVDVGASEKPPDIWQTIAPLSHYVGFDPDLREIHEDRLSGFHRKVMVNKAVTSNPSATTVKFHLTSSPFCSSTLVPNPAALDSYIYAEQYLVEKEAVVEAVTLDAALQQLSLTRLDWLKLDTQGTDLQIFQSLSEGVRSRVLALDIEPGMTFAYHHEDMFGDAHAWLIANGFWLSDLKPMGTARIRASTWEKVQGSRSSFAKDALAAAFKKSPCWCEARYLRTLTWLKEHAAGEGDYLLLWTFALLDNQHGFALDVAEEYGKLFGKEETRRLLWEHALALLEKRRLRLPMIAPTETLKLVLPKSVKRVLKGLLGLVRK